jgi:magnesium transporter
VIVDCAVYEGGHRRTGKLPLEQAGEAGRREGSFVWLGVYEPTEDEFDAVRREFDLHELAVEDAIRAHQRPKVEVYGETLFVVLKTVRYVEEDEAIASGELLLFINPDFVVSVRHGEGSALADVRRRIEARPDLLCCGSGAVLYAIVDRVVDDYEPAAEGLEIDIQEVERQVFSPTPDNPAERIYLLEREVLELHAAVGPLAPAVDRLARGQFDLIDPDLRTYFRDVHDHLLRVLDRVEGFRQLLSSALQANLTQVSVRQNEVAVRQSQDMRRISAWVAILAVPTMVAGIYGMNFEHMPELKWTFGYPLVMGVIAVACIVLYWRFRKSGWL